MVENELIILEHPAAPPPFEMLRLVLTTIFNG